MRPYWMQPGFFLVVLAIAVPLSAESPEVRGDRAFRSRSEGFEVGGTPNSQPIEIAITAYQEALDRAPTRVDLHVKLMSALCFKGYYVVRDRRQQREIFQRTVAIAASALERINLEADQKELSQLSPEEQAKALQAVPRAAAVHYWAATGWGMWGVTHHPLSAVRKGVAGRVHKHSKIASLLDESYDHAGGLRFLGQLHAAAPRVPFITGWVDRQEGLRLLRRAVELSRDDPRNLLFLAEAILEHDREHRDEALELLRELDRGCSHPENIVEHSEAIELARQRLAELEAR